jgi:hypothetical protein
MYSALPARIVDAVFDRLERHADIFEALVLMDDDDLQTLKDDLADVVQHEITRDAIAAIDALAQKGRRP